MARTSSISLAMKLFALGGGFLYAVAAARLLGPSGYGELAVAVSVANVAAILAVLGINGLAVREVARFRAEEQWGELRRFVRWSLMVTGAASLITAAAVALLSFVGGPFASELLLAAPMIPLLALLQSLRGITHGGGWVVAAQVPLDVVRWLMVLLLLGLLTVAGAGASTSLILGVVLVALLASLFVSVTLVVLIRRSIPSAAATESVANGKWFSAAAPFLGIALFGILGSEINTILLGWLAGPEQAGLYQPIARIAPIMIIAVEAVGMPLAPRVAAMWQAGDKHALARSLQRAALAATLATGGIAAGIAMLGSFILGAFGPVFAGNAHLLLWIAGAQLVNAATGASPLLLSMSGKMQYRIGIQIVTLIAQAGIGALLVARFGASGAAAALVAAILIWSLLHWIIARRVTGIDSSVVGLMQRRRTDTR